MVESPPLPQMFPFRTMRPLSLLNATSPLYFTSFIPFCHVIPDKLRYTDEEPRRFKLPPAAQPRRSRASWSRRQDQGGQPDLPAGGQKSLALLTAAEMTQMRNALDGLIKGRVRNRKIKNSSF